MKKFLALIFCFGMVGMASPCLADVGPSCGGGGYREPCWDINCEYDAFCLIKTNEYGDMWIEGLSGYSQEDIEMYYIVEKNVRAGEYCESYCQDLAKACDSDECRAQYESVNVDCSSLANENARKNCEEQCNNTILSSKCGVNCLLNGIPNDAYFQGCAWASEKQVAECEARNSDDDDCAALPLNQKNHWSLLSILLTLLAMGTAGLIVFVNRKGESKK